MPRTSSAEVASDNSCTLKNFQGVFYNAASLAKLRCRRQFSKPRYQRWARAIHDYRIYSPSLRQACENSQFLVREFSTVWPSNFPGRPKMKLIKQNIERKDGSGSATLLPEEPEDMVRPSYSAPYSHIC